MRDGVESGKDRLKFGIVGCGQISNRHFEAFDQIEGIELVAVCDNKEDRAQKAGEERNVPWYRNYEDILRHEDIDIMSVCTPHNLHVPMAMGAASAGKHALIEKPIGINLREVDEMLAHFSALDKKIFALLQVRHNPPLISLRELIEKKALGTIHNVALVVRWYRPQEYYDRSDWHGVKATEGGFLLSQGIHYIDTIRWLFGPVKSVNTKVRTAGHDIETEDLVTGIIEFQSGAFATLEMSLCTYPQNLECSLSVLGSQGSLKISGSALNQVETWQIKDVPQPKLEEVAPNVYAGGLYQGSCPNHTAIYNDIQKFFTRGDSYIDGHAARDAIELVDAIYLSANEGREVKFD